MATSLGIHDIYVNGQLVGDEVLKPGFTHPEKTKYSFTYDITGAINTAPGAENQYSAQVTPGWWADKIITYSGHDGMIGDKCAFRAVLELTFADGTKQLYGTDTEAWKAGIGGPVKHAAIFDAEMMSQMAQATGRDAAKYQQMAADAKQYLKDTFLTPEGTFKTEILNTMQTPALFALRNGLVEGQAREDMVARLRANFAEHDNCLQTGFLGTSILMNTLTDNGMGDIAYELLFQRKNPSWLYSIDNGATTIWERWNSYMLDKGMGPNSMNSFNHYAYGCVCEWLWQTAAGIKSDPAAPGFKNIIMSPMPDPRLGSLTAEYQSAAGLIKSAWRYDGPKWTWTFTIPSGSTATVTLPGSTKSKTYRAGTHTLTCKL